MRYAPLHNHTIYSIKDAISTPRDYLDYIYEYNESQSNHEIVALAITEHSNVFSLTEHHIACTTPKKGDAKKRTLKPIYGNEIYHCDNKSDYSSLAKRYHMVVLVKNQEGLKTFTNLTTHCGVNSYKSSKKEYQIIDTCDIKNFGKGLIGLSACLGGKIPKLILENKIDEAEAFALEMNNIFDEFYLEIQPHDLPDQKIVNAALIEISKRTGLKLVITSDSHFAYKNDREYHDIMKTIDAISSAQDPKNFIFNTDNHMWTPDELIDWCTDNNIPLEAIENTALIADTIDCSIEIKNSKGLFPDFPVPIGYTENSYLIKEATNGLIKKFVRNKKIKDLNKYMSRLNYELDVITQMGYSGYFLILWDWLKWCKEQKIPINVGRGSGAGSLVNYALDITKVDPIEGKLLFERFLNPSRKDEPDIDTDISKVHRPAALRYLQQKYGVTHVSQICNFNRFGLKNTIRVLMSSSRGFKKEEQDDVSKAMPEKIGDMPVSYETMLNVVNDPDKFFQDDSITTREYNDVIRGYNKLLELFQKYPEIENALLKLKGAVNSIGCHAGGIVISSKRISDYVPLMKTHGSAVMNVTQLDMDGVHYFKMLKLDMLGLKAMSQIGMCLELANIPFEWLDNEEYDDPNVYEFLRLGNTKNVFQMAKPVPTKMIKDNKVETIEGLSDINSLNRPGCQAKDKVTNKSISDKYLNTILTGEVETYHPDIDHIMKETHNQILFQEQIMQIGMILAGYSLGMADLRLRKPIAKKDQKVIAEIKNEFIYGKLSLYDNDGNVIGVSDEDSPNCPGCIKNGYSEALGIRIFKVIEDFSKYCFNRSHSLCYAITGYRSAYLSLYYPVEWAISCLTLDNGDKDKMIATFNDCKKRGFKILPPSINTSDENFTVDRDSEGNKAIRFGLLAIDKIGKKPIDAIKIIREDGEIKSFNDFLVRIMDKSNKKLTENKHFFGDKSNKFTNPINKQKIEALILSGSFDDLEPNRHKLFNEYAEYRRTILKKKDMTDKDENVYRTREKLAYELQYLNFYVSQHPLDGASYSYTDISLCNNGDKVTFSGILKTFTKKKTKGGKPYYVTEFELRDGAIVRVNIWDNMMQKFGFKQSLFTCNRAKEGRQIFTIVGNYDSKWNNVSPTSMKVFVSKEEQEKIDNLNNKKTSEGILSLDDMIKNIEIKEVPTSFFEYE